MTPIGAMAGAGEAVRFSYHRGIAPMLWALAGIAVVEVGVVHLLVAVLWSKTAALVLSLLSIVALIWLLRLLLTMPKRPVLLWRDRLVLRVGTFRCVILPVTEIADVRMDIEPQVARDRSIINIALLSHPNILVALREPLAGRPSVRAIAHCLDDPTAFVRAVEALRTPA